jgi:hypothetical protein
MNTAVLLLAAFAPGADPVKQVQYPYSDYAPASPSIPMYAPSPYAARGYGDPNAGVPERRQRFPRLRAFFNRRSQDNDTQDAPAAPAASYARTPSGMPGITRGSVVGPQMTPSSPGAFSPIEDGAVIIGERTINSTPTSGPSTPAGSTPNVKPERINVQPTPNSIPTQKMPVGDPF